MAFSADLQRTKQRDTSRYRASALAGRRPFNVFNAAPVIAYDRLVLPHYLVAKEGRDADAIEEQAPVIIAGVGRFGQIICRLLRANNIPMVVLDLELEQIENSRQINIKSYFGDASRSDLLERAGD